jgi:hypothetical protein
MKIIITESQYKKVLIREFGETESDPKKWYRKILKWVDGDRSRLKFSSDPYEVIVYDDKGIYLGYYDKELSFGFVVTEYGIGMNDYTEEDGEVIDEQENGGSGGDAPAGGTSSVWPLSDLARSVANTLTNDPHYTSGNHPTSSSWEDKIGRGPANQLT